MNPSSEVGNASGEEMGIGETMEAVVTTVDAMTTAVEAVEAMVIAVEMREWLEVGRTETERTTAVHFFSRALAVQKQKSDFPRYVLPPYWPGLLPDLVQLLADCLLPHNSEAIQCDAMRSIKGLSSTYPYDLCDEICGHVSDHLLRLVRETECTKIREQATLSLGRIAAKWPYPGHFRDDQRMVLLPLFVDLVSKYAAILEPTDAEISILNTAIKALYKVLWLWQPPVPPILKIVPVLVGIVQKPGKRKKAQIWAIQCLDSFLPQLHGDFILESGVIGVLVEALRLEKETPILFHALEALWNLMYHYHVDVVRKEILDMGAVGAFHLILKRPNDSFECFTLWSKAIACLGRVIIDSNEEEKVEAVLSQDGLVELVLDLGRW